MEKRPGRSRTAPAKPRWQLVINTRTTIITFLMVSNHRAREYCKFLDEIENNVPTDLDIHIVMDNASSQKTKLIRDWFAKRPRWHRHFTPTSASWINQLERFFALLSEKQIKRGDPTRLQIVMLCRNEMTGCAEYARRIINRRGYSSSRSDDVIEVAA
jgi:transposase